MTKNNYMTFGIIDIILGVIYLIFLFTIPIGIMYLVYGISMIRYAKGRIDIGDVDIGDIVTFNLIFNIFIGLFMYLVYNRSKKITVGE